MGGIVKVFFSLSSIGESIVREKSFMDKNAALAHSSLLALNGKSAGIEEVDAYLENSIIRELGPEIKISLIEDHQNIIRDAKEKILKKLTSEEKLILFEM